MRYDDTASLEGRLEFGGASPANLAELTSVMGRKGFVRAQEKANRRHLSRVTEAGRLLADIIEGKADASLFGEAMNPGRNRYRTLELMETYPGLFPARESISLRETMSYSDYSALTVDVLNRILYGYYTEAPMETMALVKKRPLRDFRIVAGYAMDAGTKPWSAVYEDTNLPATPHAAAEPPTERSMLQAAREVTGSAQRVTYQPQLYQGKMAVNWRALVNDDLGIFQDMTNRLAIGGRRTIMSFITSLYIADSGGGYNTTLYNSTFGNLVTPTYGASATNPALSFQGLSDALTVLQAQTDLDGQPIVFDGTIYLWFGPALFTTAMNILKQVQADISVLGGTQAGSTGYPAARLRVENWMADGIKPIQDKYIPLVNKTASKNTIWGLTYEPASQARPSLELGFLTGYDTPQLFQKVPNTMRVGGGVDPMLGDFYTMDQEYKGCLVMGGTQVDGRSTVVSTGLGV